MKEKASSSSNEKVRAGISKRSRKTIGKVYQEIKLEVEDVLSSSVFNGYRFYDVQELELKLVNICYLQACWLTL